MDEEMEQIDCAITAVAVVNRSSADREGARVAECGMFVDLACVQTRGNGQDLKSRARLIDIDHCPVLQSAESILGKVVWIVGRIIRPGEDFTVARIDDQGRGSIAQAVLSHGEELFLCQVLE